MAGCALITARRALVAGSPRPKAETGRTAAVVFGGAPSSFLFRFRTSYTSPTKMSLICIKWFLAENTFFATADPKTPLALIFLVVALSPLL